MFFSLFSLFCKNKLILLSSLNFKFLCSCSILTMQVCGHFMLYRSGHAQIPVLLTKFSNFKKLQLELYLVLPIMHIPNLCLKVLKSYHCPTLFCSLSFNLCKNSRKIFFLSRSVKPGSAIMSVILVKMRSSSATMISCNFFILTLRSWICSLYLIILKFGNSFLTSKSKLFANQDFLTLT